MAWNGLPVTLHASCVALDDRRGLLILGASGRGKSALALQLMALGAHLVADDRTILVRDGANLIAAAPETLSGLIEARGLGILRAPALRRATVTLAVDLDQTEPDRLPPHRRIVFCGCEISLAYGPVTPHFPAAILHYLRHGRHA
ncbi:MAG: HPr kinase/phosphorylase [Gemmobacter sp.]